MQTPEQDRLLEDALSASPEELNKALDEFQKFPVVPGSVADKLRSFCQLILQDEINALHETD